MLRICGFYIKHVLSERYCLPDGAILIGEICEIVDWFGNPMEVLLIGFEAKLIYVSKEPFKEIPPDLYAS